MGTSYELKFTSRRERPVKGYTHGPRPLAVRSNVVFRFSLLDGAVSVSCALVSRWIQGSTYPPNLIGISTPFLDL